MHKYATTQKALYRIKWDFNKNANYVLKSDVFNTEEFSYNIIAGLIKNSIRKINILIKNETIFEEFGRESGYSSYNPTIGLIDGAIMTAWIHIENDVETLKLRDKDGRQFTIYSGRYILSPCISAGHILFSAWQENDDWQLFACKYCCSGEMEIKKIGNVSGRVMSIRGENRNDGKGSWITYERRQGKRVRVYAAFFDGDEWRTDIPVSDELYNAYDPHIANSEESKVYIIYSSFIYGNYHIMLQEMDRIKDGPIRISTQPGISYWPSITQRKGGGVWLCWTSFAHIRQRSDPYIKHNKYRNRRSLFTYMPVVYTAAYIDDELHMLIPQNSNKLGFIEANFVENSIGAKYPNILQMEDGSLHIIYRKFKGDKMQFSSPNISISSLTDKGWKEQDIVMPAGLHEGFASIVSTGNSIYMAFARDNRMKWNDKIIYEWFNKKSTIQLGNIEVDLAQSENVPIKTEKQTISPIPIPSIEEDNVELIENSGKSKLIWGQTHGHTNFSICQRMNDQSIDINYRFYQDVQKADFGATTDHAFNMWPLEQHISHKMADYYYFKGEFIAFPGYEWTGSECSHEGGPFGHVNPIYLEEDGKMKFYTPLEKGSEGSSLKKLYRTYSKDRIITIPHHTADNIHTFNWDFYDENMVPVVEIFQDNRGQNEQPNIWGTTAFKKKDNSDGWVICALKRGYRLGFVGGGDHIGMALAGVEIEELTRRSLYKAIMKRRTFASTGSRADIKFSCNDQSVGSIIKCKRAGFKLLLSTNELICKIQIVRNGVTMKCFDEIEANMFDYRWEVMREEDEEFWYIRILLSNGEIFWTSPIWLIGNT